MLLLLKETWLQLHSENNICFASPLLNIDNVEETEALVNSFKKGHLVHIKNFFEVIVLWVHSLS